MVRGFLSLVGLSIIFYSLNASAVIKNNVISNDRYEFKTTNPPASPAPSTRPSIAPSPKPAPSVYPSAKPFIRPFVVPSPSPSPSPQPIVVAPPGEAPEGDNPEVTLPYFEAPPALAKLPVVTNPVDTLNVDAKVSYPGVTYRGNQRAATVTACGDLAFVSEGKCQPVNMAADFAPFLLKNIPMCINVALKALGHKEAATILVDHYGAYRDRTVDGSDKWSMHSTGRAMDIREFKIKTVDGKTVTRKMTIINKNEKFYETFNNCWTNINAKRTDCRNDDKFRRCRPSDMAADCGTNAGTIDCRDSDHTTHVHISMPLCPTQPSISST